MGESLYVGRAPIMIVRDVASANHHERLPTECVKLFETTVSSKCYAAIVSGWLMKTVGSSAGGSGVPFTKRFGLRAYAA